MAAPGVVTLLGPGGVGKTRLAVEYARSAGLDARVVWLDELSEGDELTERLAAALELSTGGDDLRRSAAILEKKTDLLLIFDNAEHVADDTRQLLEQLPLSSVRVLVTSRVPLGVAGEQVVQVPELSVSEARELLTARANLLGVELVAEGVDELLEALDRLPLAIELAAARTVILTPAQIVEKLKDSNQILTTAEDSRHGALDRTIAWSWKLLDEQERKIASALALSDHPILPEQIEEMWPELDVWNVAQSLEVKSWLRVGSDSHGKRWSTLWAMRRFVRSYLGEEDLREHHERLREWAASHLDEPSGWWASYVPQALKAVELMRAAGNYEDAGRLLGRTFFGAFGGPHFSRALDAAVDLLEEWSPEQNPEVWASLASKVSKGAFRLEGRHVALDWSSRAFTVAPPQTAAALAAGSQHVICLLDAGRREGADAIMEEVVSLRDRLRPDTLLAAALLDVATAAHEMGRFDVTRDTCETVLEIGRRDANADVKARAWIHLSYVSYDLGEFDRAAQEIGQLERLLEDRHPHEALALGGAIPALLDLQMGRDEQAFRSLTERLNVAVETRYKVLEFFVTLAFAEWAARNEPESVRGFLDRALSLAAVSGSAKSLGHVRFLIAIDQLASRDFAAAASRLSQLREVRCPASPTHWYAALDAVEWLCSALLGRTEPVPQSDYGRLFGQVWESLELVDGEPLRRFLQSEDGRKWNVPGLYFLRLDDVARRLYDRLAEDAPVRLCVEADGRRFRLGEQPVVDMTRRGVLRRLLVRLVEERANNPGNAVDVEVIIEAGWPDEKILHDAARTRVYTAMNRLRGLGFGEFLVTTDDGYALDESLAVEWVESLT